jgi:protein-S-isoprenylcysteine O-methyltransferase Ste14
MIDEIVASHRFLVEFFALFVLSGVAIPKMTAGNPLKFRKASFIYTMTFQAIATMAAFTGLVALVVGKYAFGTSIILMVLIWGALMFIEIKKYRAIKSAWIETAHTHQLLQSLFYKITAVEFFLIVVMIVMKMMEVKGAVSLP